MHRIAKMICKYRVLILILAVVLLIPALIGMVKTRVNYDILVYLPEDVETIQGENILTEDFEMGAYSIILANDVPEKQILEFEEKLRQMDNVSMVASVADILGEGIPKDVLPDEIKEKIYCDDTTVIMVTFKAAISSDETMETVEDIRKIADDKFEISGMTAVLLDTKFLSDNEMLVYIVIAVILCLIVLEITLDSWIAPLLLLINIGLAIAYNMGTNIFMGEVSYITKAVAAVLQLGVTTDFAIFLYHSYMENKKVCNDKMKSMENAILETMGSVFGSSITTIAGFLALCGMDLTLGKDIGIVMAKGVFFGVICVVTILPAMLLCFDKIVEKSKHKVLLPQFTHIKNFVMKHYKIIILVFLIILPIAIYGYNNTDIYYNLDAKLPKDLPGIKANTSLEEKFNVVALEMVLVDNDVDSESVNNMLDKINNIDGVNWVIGTSKISEMGIPESIIPEELLSKIQTEKYSILLISSNYGIATTELNNQINEINKIIKSYDDGAILAGVGPLMKDLAEIAHHDFNIVNTVSIGIIFIIMLIILKSISLPIILMVVIEFAIFINMGIPYYTGTVLPFVASIVIGTIQLGATIDYAILITSKYIKTRCSGKSKDEAIDYSLGTSICSIITSGLCFFGATIGVGIYSKIEIISSLCVLLARGAIISMVVVILLLPSFLIVFDKLICKSTWKLRKINHTN